MGFFVIGSICDTYNKFKVSWPESLIFFDSHKCIFYNWQKDVNKNGYKAVEISFKKNGEFKNIKKKYDQLVKKINLRIKEIDKKYLKNLSTSNLIQNYHKDTKLLMEFWNMAILAELSAYGADAYLTKHITKTKLKTETNEALNILTSSSTFSFFQKEELSLLNILAKINDKNINKLKTYRDWLKYLDKNKNLKNKFDLHTNKYNWILNNYEACTKLTNTFFYKKAWDLLKKEEKLIDIIKSYKTNLRQKNLKRQKILSQISTSQHKLIFYAKIANKAVAWHDHKKEKQLEFQTILNDYLQEFAKRFKINFQNLLYYFPWEIDDLINNIKLPKVNDKKKLFLLFVKPTDKNIKVLQNKSIETIFKKYKQTTKKSIKVIKGIAVSKTNKNKIIGKVKILNNPKEINRIKKGDILVTQMTSPDYILAIKKASAIITDAGGLTCHAAVISRELKIPCIVGTKFATRIFKNGDIIEVDADKGIIKKI